MSAARPTLSLSRKTPLKSKKSGSSSSSGKKKTTVAASSSTSAAAAPKPWVDTVQDLNAYRPSKEELESKKAQRKSQNKVLAKVSLSDKRSLHLDPERQRLIQQQVMLDYRRQPSQNVEAILARSEQVMGICQGILNGEMITPTYQPISPASSLPCLAEPAIEEEVQQEGAEGIVSSSSSMAAEEATLGGLDRLRGRPSPSVLPGGVVQAPVQPVTNPPYMNSAALNEIAGELLITVRELREELLQEREARERLEREVLQQRELLSELCREVLRLQIHCSGQQQPADGREFPKQGEAGIARQLEGTRIV